MWTYLLFLAAINSSYYESISTEAVATSSVIAINSLEEIAEEDSDTLFVFDVDEVLIATADQFLRPELEPTFLGLVQEAMSQAKSSEEKNEIEKKLSISLTATKRVLVEGSSPHYIYKLQEKGHKVVALTSHPTGKLGLLEDVALWKVEQLKSFCFHFERSFPERKNHTLTELSKPDVPSPIYLDGILFSRGYSKGEVLLSFLKENKPKKVIFIDDLLKNHESVSLALGAHNIAFQGYHYKKCALPHDAIDKALVTSQFTHLMQHGHWLSDIEAKTHLGHNP